MEIRYVRRTDRPTVCNRRAFCLFRVSYLFFIDGHTARCTYVSIRQEKKKEDEPLDGDDSPKEKKEKKKKVRVIFQFL